MTSVILKANEFFDYLHFIGILPIHSIQTFKNTYTSILSSGKSSSLFDIIRKTLIHYFSQLNSSLIAEISNEILTKYISFKSEQFYKKINALVQTYSKIELSLKSNALGRMRENKVKNIYMLKRKLSQPNGNYESHYKEVQKNKSKSVNNLNKTTDTSEPSIVNFIQRQEVYDRFQRRTREKLIQDSEDEYNLIYTFNPKIEKNPNIKSYFTNSNIATHERLYQEGMNKVNVYKKGDCGFSRRNKSNNEQVNRNKKYYQKDNGILISMIRGKRKNIRNKNGNNHNVMNNNKSIKRDFEYSCDHIHQKNLC